MQGTGKGGADKHARSKQMSKRKANLLYKSFHYRKKFIYVILSILLSAGLTVMDLYDLTVLLSLHRADLTTHTAVNSLMILHLISFFLSLLGFVHSLETKYHNLAIVAIAAGGLSLLSLAIKLIKELTLAGFFLTEYAVT